MPVVNVSSSLRLGILKDFAEIYRNRYPVFAERQDKFIKRSTNIKTRTAEFGLKESIPFPNYWPLNTPRRRSTFKDRYITVYHYPFQLTIPWNKFDEADDVLGDLRAHVEGSVNRFLQIPDVMVADYLNNAATLQPSLSNAFDGAALCASTAGGSDRFGVSGGNIITSSGVSQVSQILHDLFQARQRFLQMRDTEGQPFFAPEEVAFDRMTVVCPAHLTEVFTQAQEMRFGYVNSGINTAQSNVLMNKFNLWINQRLDTSSNDWYVFLDHPYLKPFFYLVRDDIQSMIEDETNSDHARDTGQYAFMSHIRSGMIPFSPMSVIQVNS